ncbi:MAG: AlpA family phage regulatory protein [Acidimicrobiia bacterium]|nr:AlpA family phage regulatory protein [Acidimicrobiia bacterium]
MAATGLSRTTLWRLSQCGQFPNPVRFGREHLPGCRMASKRHRMYGIHTRPGALNKMAEALQTTAPPRGVQGGNPLGGCFGSQGSRSQVPQRQEPQHQQKGG